MGRENEVMVILAVSAGLVHLLVLHKQIINSTLYVVSLRAYTLIRGFPLLEGVERTQAVLTDQCFSCCQSGCRVCLGSAFT